MKSIKFGSTEVRVTEKVTHTRFSDGAGLYASHLGQPGQEELARSLGYSDATAMNRHHDLTHSLLAHWLGLPHSPTLRGIADKNYWPHHKLEEAAVLAVQAYALAAGIDLIKVAEHADTDKD